MGGIDDMHAGESRNATSPMSIPLTRGYSALVSPDDYEQLAQFKWHANENGGRGGYVYASTHVRVAPGRSHNRKMHRIITRAPDHLVVDHINGNTLDNRRENLRVCTRSVNNANQHTRVIASSGVRNIEKAKDGFFRVVLGRGNAKHYVGSYRDLYSAQIAREAFEKGFAACADLQSLIDNPRLVAAMKAAGINVDAMT